jgi:hypothetical protein
MRVLPLFFAAVCLAGCAVSTEFRAPERQYKLASDTRVWTDCSLFTGWYSLNISGPESVLCFVAERYNSQPVLAPEKVESDKSRMITLTQGSVVKIKRIFTTNHDGVKTAELLVTESASGQVRQVFAQYWPYDNPNLLTPIE